MINYDVAIIGAGPGGIYAAYELMEKKPTLRVAVFEAGNALDKRNCPIDGDKVKGCVGCRHCSIMSGFGGAGAFSDGKFNITNEFGGSLHEKIGKKRAIELMEYIDDVNMSLGGEGTRLYDTEHSEFKRICIQNHLRLLGAKVRHLGTDVNYKVLDSLYSLLVDKGVEFHFNSRVDKLEKVDGYYSIKCGSVKYTSDVCIVSVGRSGSKWLEETCKSLGIDTKSNRVDIGVRVEIPAEVFEHITKDHYEAKITHLTEQYCDTVRTFCMNPHGIVVSENTNGIITVNGHSYNDPILHTENTNFALLVSQKFSEPFRDSNEYGENIAKLSNMLGGGVIVQRFGDLIRGRRSTDKRIKEGTVVPTLSATPGDLSLVLPKRILDDIIDMIRALAKIAPGMDDDNTLLYGVEVKFYNMEVDVDENLETIHKGLYVIGDGSGITHSLSHAAASGVYVARKIASETAE